MSYDLILKVKQQISKDGFASMQEQLNESDIAVFCEVVHFDFDSPLEAYDLDTFMDAMHEHEFTKEQYFEFCRLMGFPETVEPPSPAAAARFLQERWGRPISCMMFTGNVENTKVAYPLIVQFARSNQLILDDPQQGEDINLDDPGELPPAY